MAQASFGEPVDPPVPRLRPPSHRAKETSTESDVTQHWKQEAAGRVGRASDRPNLATAVPPARALTPMHPPTPRRERAASPDGLPLQSTGVWESLKHHVSQEITLI